MSNDPSAPNATNIANLVNSAGAQPTGGQDASGDVNAQTGTDAGLDTRDDTNAVHDAQPDQQTGDGTDSSPGADPESDASDGTGEAQSNAPAFQLDDITTGVLTDMMGWSQEDIDNRVKAIGPEMARREFAQVTDRYARSLAQRATPQTGSSQQQGTPQTQQQAPGQGQQQAQPGAQQVPGSPVAGMRAALPKLLETYGNEPDSIVNMAIKPLIDLVETLHQQTQAMQLKPIMDETNRMFIDPKVGTNAAKTFGSSWDKLSAAQQTNRQMVIASAAELYNSLRRAGREVTEEAVVQYVAQRFVPAETKTQAVDQVRSQVKARAGGLSPAPVNRPAARPTPRPAAPREQEAGVIGSEIQQWAAKNGVTIPKG